MGPTFYLGTHRPNWLGLTDVPLFVSHGTLGKRKSLPRARGTWCLDSRGFTELKDHGHWTITPKAYATAAQRYQQEIGQLQWASIQDWMVEPFILAKTGLTVKDHQQRSVASYFDLMELAPEVPWAPVLQGWEPSEYHAHVEMYDRAGVDLRCQPIVGVGSVCRRQRTDEAEGIFRSLAGYGIRLHGFGVKSAGLLKSAAWLKSADSMAWSYAARRRHAPCPAGTTTHKNCANCLPYALKWRDALLSLLRSAPDYQQGLGL